jgi:hypothetical protein
MCPRSRSPARRTLSSAWCRTATWSPAAPPGRTSSSCRRACPTRRGRTTSWRRCGATSTAPARPGIFVAVLTDGVNSWIVVESRLNYFGTTSQQVFQAWIGLDGAEDITFAYDPGNLPDAPPAGYGLTVGAENLDGSGGDQTAPTSPGTAPTEDQRVTSTAGTPGGSLTYSYKVVGDTVGSRTVRTDMTAPALVRGTTTDVDTITVTP